MSYFLKCYYKLIYYNKMCRNLNLQHITTRQNQTLKHCSIHYHDSAAHCTSIAYSLLN